MNEENSLLILDDDEIFCKRLQTAMSRKGFNSYGAYSIREAKDLLKESIPKYAVIDLRLGDGNGLEIVSIISKQRNDSKIVILTGMCICIGYKNIPVSIDDAPKAVQGERNVVTTISARSAQRI